MNEQIVALEERYEQAFNSFERMYTLRNPPPVRDVVDSEDRLIKLALVLMVVASLVVSASHTIPTFVGTEAGLVSIAVAFAAFSMIEVGVIAYAYIRTRQHYRLHPDRPANVGKWLAAGFWLALAVAIAANIHYTLKTRGFADTGVGWAIFDFMVALAVGFSAPVLAFISGDVLGMLSVVDAQRQRKADRQWREATEAWRDSMLRSWSANKGRMGVRVEADSNSTPGLSNGIIGMERRSVIPSASTLGHSKQPQASRIVRDYLIEHPEALEMNPLELAALLNVGKSTVYNVLKELRGE